MSWDRVVALVKRLVDEGSEVHVVQESCGFGFGLHHCLEDIGARSYVVAPEQLGRRKSDKLDATKMANKLWDLLMHGDSKALKCIRIPTELERQERAEGRLREQLLRSRKDLENYSHCLMIDHGFRQFKAMWWQSGEWKRVSKTLENCAPWLLEILEGQRETILMVVKRIAQLGEQISKSANQQTSGSSNDSQGPGNIDARVATP